MGSSNDHLKFHAAIDAFNDADHATLDHVRAVYDAAANILNDNDGMVPDPNNTAAVWQLRAAYIDAHAAYYSNANINLDALVAARYALAVAAGHTVTE
jgi:type VI protein secretion system component VasF